MKPPRSPTPQWCSSKAGNQASKRSVSPGKVLSSGGLYVGTPAKRVRDLRPEELDFLRYSAAHYVKLKDRHLSSSVTVR